MSSHRVGDAGPYDGRVTAELHAIDAAAVASALGVDPVVGLTTDEVARRAQESGPNAISGQATPTDLSTFSDSVSRV